MYTPETRPIGKTNKAKCLKRHIENTQVQWGKTASLDSVKISGYQKNIDVGKSVICNYRTLSKCNTFRGGWA